MINELKWTWQEVVITQFHILLLLGICLLKGSEEHHKTSLRVAAILCLELISTQRCRCDDACAVIPLFKVSLESRKLNRVSHACNLTLR
jgi:hypothetical protein